MSCNKNISSKLSKIKHENNTRIKHENKKVLTLYYTTDFIIN